MQALRKRGIQLFMEAEEIYQKIILPLKEELRTFINENKREHKEFAGCVSDIKNLYNGLENKINTFAQSRKEEKENQKIKINVWSGILIGVSVGVVMGIIQFLANLIYSGGLK